jgi:hypothetical protein
MASLLALADEVIELPLFAAPAHVRFWHKADMAITLIDVRFWM